VARKVFFSFHYQLDAWRAGQVRNSNIVGTSLSSLAIPQHEFVDSVEWETVRLKDDNSIRRWIDGQLDYTSVTVVLIGAETASRRWVLYEIEKSYEKGNGLLGLRIHSIKDQKGSTSSCGTNPFEKVRAKGLAATFYNETLAQSVKCYDWVLNDGRNNLGRWIEEAARTVGR
jgi:hypothetical protein